LVFSCPPQCNPRSLRGPRAFSRAAAGHPRDGGGWYNLSMPVVYDVGSAQFDEAVRLADPQGVRRDPCGRAFLFFYIDGQGLNVNGARRWRRFEIRWLAGRPVRRKLRSYPRIDGVPPLKAAVPTLTVIAGPNGSGKSNAHPILRNPGPRPVAGSRYHSPRLSPLNPTGAAIAAGREVLKRTADYLNLAVEFRGRDDAFQSR